jgi:AcrR family transcriptional regulator
MPRETLTREQIVAAAIDLLDAEGLEGLNMRALGARLGSAATAVYWHIGNKDNLIALAGDQVWNEIVLPDLTELDWRAAATQMAGGLYAMLVRHPWLLQAFGSFLVYGPGKARHDDHNLAIYENAGFTRTRADQAATAVFTYVLGNALGPAAAGSFARRLDREGADATAAMTDRMARLSEIAGRYPRLRTRLDAPSAGYATAPERAFEFGLQALLDGLQAHLDTRPAKARRSSRAAATRPRPAARS